MAGRARFLLVTLILLGCGGPSGGAAEGFLNETQHADAALWTIWRAAQQNVATKIDLNPVQRQASQVAPVILAGDARALNIEPHRLLVAAEADVSSQVLAVKTGIHRPDPTGMIACPQPCDVLYAAAYSLYHPATVRYAKSWEFAGDNFSAIMQYEFENQILSVPGYDVKWR
jgi:hypothetical protein